MPKNQPRYSHKLKIIVILVIILIATEITLRFFGLGNPVLLQADPMTGYRFQPNQELIRFGKKIQYNQYSQRSEPITSQKPPGILRILMIGDSVLNGGNPTDQSQTISELLEAKLSASERLVNVLNASAGSWGIGNELGYFQEFGMFDSDSVIIQIGTDDLTQPTSTSDPVGHHPDYPNKKPFLAIQEALSRYILPKLFPQKKAKISPSPGEIQQQFERNMQSFRAIATLVQTQKIPLFVLFTPNRSDLLPVFNVPKYKPEFLQLLKSLKVGLIDMHSAWSNFPKATVESYYRDRVHLTVAGNQAVVEQLLRTNSTLLQPSL